MVNAYRGIVKSLLYYIPPIICFIFFSLPEIFGGTVFLLLGIALITPFGIYILKVNKSRLHVPILFLSFAFAGSLMNLINTSYGLGGSFILIGSFFLSLFIIYNIRVGMILALLYLIYVYMFLYSKIFIEGVDPNYIYEEIGFSKNHPGCLIVSFLCLYSFLKYLNYGKLPLIMPIIGVILTFFLDGRSSFGVTIAIAFVCIVFRSQKKKYVFLYFILVLFFLSYYWDDLMSFYSLSALSDKGTDNSTREIIWNSYLSHLDFFSLLFGLDSDHIPKLAEFSGNPHNSFLNFHRRMGLFGVIALLYLIVYSIRKYLKKKDYILVLFIMLYMIRILFDTVLVSTFDFVFYSMLYYSTIKGIDFYPYKGALPSKRSFKKIINLIINIL